MKLIGHTKGWDIPSPIAGKVKALFWWARPPLLEDEALQFTANQLYFTIKSIWVVCLLLLPMLAPFHMRGGTRLIICAGCILLFSTLAMVLAHKGWPRIGAWTFIVLAWALLSGMATTGGGVIAPVFLYLFLLIVIAGLMLGRKASLGMSGLVLVAIVGLGWLEASDRMPGLLVHHTVWSRGISLGTLGFVFAAVLWRSSLDADTRLAQKEAVRQNLEHQVLQRTQQLAGMNDELINAKRELEAANKVLEERVASRTASLRDALGLAQAADRAKYLFLERMGHELRTPLNQVILYSQLIAGDGEPGNPEARADIQAVLSSGKTLEDLIHNILTYSDLCSGMVEPEIAPFDPGMGLLGSIEAIYRPLAEAKQLSFWIEVDPAIPTSALGDAPRLGQVLKELVSNAVKFTQTGQVSLRVHPTNQPGVYRFEVEDTGPGITEAQRPTLFEAFEKSIHDAGRDQGGIGLGLALAKRLVTVLGGQIGIESRPETGSLAWVTVPLPESAVPPESNPKLLMPVESHHHTEHSIRSDS